MREFGPVSDSCNWKNSRKR